MAYSGFFRFFNHNLYFIIHRFVVYEDFVRTWWRTVSWRLKSIKWRLVSGWAYCNPVDNLLSFICCFLKERKKAVLGYIFAKKLLFNFFALQLVNDFALPIRIRRYSYLKFWSQGQFILPLFLLQYQERTSEVYLETEEELKICGN